MPTNRPAANRATRRAQARPRKPAGTFARLKAEAAASEAPIEPYVLEDVDPPISIDPPASAEQQLALAAMFGSDGQFRIADARHVLELVCGDQFEAVWNLVRGERLAVLLALIVDMGNYWEEQGALDRVSEDDVPGGSEASSN